MVGRLHAATHTREAISRPRRKTTESFNRAVIVMTKVVLAPIMREAIFSDAPDRLLGLVTHYLIARNTT
jgi:hypothetical protein